MVAVGTTHCGSACALGDLCAKNLAMALGLTLFGHAIFAAWAVDYAFAFAFGVAFQYFTIAPMRGLSVGEGLLQAVKADALSLTAWQVGMYGFMALAHFWFFGHVLGLQLQADRVEFWFTMQLAMLAGFATSYPVNWWLLQRGIKEKM